MSPLLQSSPRALLIEEWGDFLRLNSLGIIELMVNFPFTAVARPTKLRPAIESDDLTVKAVDLTDKTQCRRGDRIADNLVVTTCQGVPDRTRSVLQVFQFAPYFALSVKSCVSPGAKLS